MAHFLEHLVFKGGEKFDDYRKVNETAERMGGSLNAYTSHDLVAFHITVRSESTMEALDLLTDFVGRPKIDQAELDKERGVVIQEIARYKDQPAAVAEELIDRAAFGDHPFGPDRPRPQGASGDLLARRDHRLPRAPLGRRARRRVHRRQHGAHGRRRRGRRAARALPDARRPRALRARPGGARPKVLVEQRDSNQSHLRMIYRPHVDVTDLSQRAALTIYSTLLGGSMGSRLFDEIREQRGLCYSVYAADHASPTCPSCSSGRAWSRASASRRSRA
jgi:predicted Zn-dependent peptidase